MSAIDEFLAHLRDSCEQDTFVRLSLTSPVAADAPVQRVIARLVELRGERHLSLTFREVRRDTTRNLPVAAALGEIRRLLGNGGFRGALLATTAAEWQLRVDGGVPKLIRHRASTAAPPPRAHDEPKPSLLGAAAQPWLEALGIVDPIGRPRRRLADKHAQIDRYVEILAHLARDCSLHEVAPGAPPLRIVDVGCGKGHLTFAAWHLAHNVLRRPAAVLGVETRADLVDGANAAARAIAGDELRFVRGDIADAALPAADVLIALHACNTATDHAIRRGIEAGARLVVVAPCCHQEVRPQLGRPEPLAAVLRHGLMAERLAEWVTDGLRALVMEWAGYRTKIVEFVGSEHTAKNVMIAAVRGAEVPTAAQRAAARDAIDRFRAFFGVQRHALDALLDTRTAEA